MKPLVPGLVAIAIGVGGCSGSPTPPGAPSAGAAPLATPVAAGPATASPQPAVAGPAPAGALTPAPEIPRPPIPDYDTRGRRDPFEVLETREGAGGITVGSARLTGIVRSEEGPIALVETAEGLGYILRPGDVLGDGRLVEIRTDSVVFTVPTKRGAMSNRVVLKLPGES